VRRSSLIGLGILLPGLALAQTPAPQPAPAADPSSDPQSAPAAEVTATAAPAGAVTPKKAAQIPIDQLIQAERAKGKLWSVVGSAQFTSSWRTDAANDRGLSYALQGVYLPWVNTRVFARIGVNQQFSVRSTRLDPEIAKQLPMDELEEELGGGDSPFKLTDLVVGGGYNQTVNLPAERSVFLSHGFAVQAPTSIVSQRRGLYAGLELRESAWFNLFSRLSVGVTAAATYRFHRYDAANQFGNNNRLALLLAPAVSVTAFDLGDKGKVFVGADASSRWRLRYNSTQSYLSPSSEQAPWFQDYGWSLGVDYQPTPNWTFSVAAQQGGSVLRDGIVRTFLIHGDETQTLVGVSGRF
jgi:hypothetical protein